MFEPTLFDECIDIIKQWQPKKAYSRELQYRDDLRDFLYENLNNPNRRSGLWGGSIFNETERGLVKKEDGRGLCDIAIGEKKVGIELKKDIKSKSQIDRLYGQIIRYKKEYTEGIIIVLVGKVNKYTEEEIRHLVSKESNTDNLWNSNQFQIKVINKSTNFNKTKPKEQKRSPFGLTFENPFAQLKLDF